MDTLQALVGQLATRGNQTCMLAMAQEGATDWTYQQVGEMATQLAYGLAQAGLQAGAYVTVLAHNRPAWLVACLGVLRAGAAVSPLDTQVKTSALKQILADSQPRFIFTTTEYVNRLRLITDARLILFDVADDDPRSWRALLSAEAVDLPTVGADDPGALFYTSGTTGTPKGVLLTQHNLAFQIQAIKEAGFIELDDRVLMPLPFYHVYPFTVGLLTPLGFGLPIILPQSLTGPQLVRALQAGGVSVIVGVPRLYRALYEGISGRLTGSATTRAIYHAVLSLSIWLRRTFGSRAGAMLFRPVVARVGPKLRLLASGGSALDPELAWKLEGLGWYVAIGYGLTETSPILTLKPPEDGVPNLASVGLPLPGIELRIAPVTDSDVEIKDGEGEIQARGVSVFTGYRNLPAETAASFTADGWFRTGDLGSIDERGYVYISGRASTLIVTEGGKNIQPEPLEETYQEHRFIAEIGILQAGPELAALVVPNMETVSWYMNGDADMAVREALAEQSKTLPSYQRVNDYALSMQPLPRTNLGKIRRHLLDEYYHQARQGLTRTGDEDTGPLAIADMSESDQGLLAHPLAQEVWDWLADRYADHRLTPDTSPQLDLGVDSLAWLTLTLDLKQRTGVELTDEAIAGVTTVRDLLQAIITVEKQESKGTASLAEPETMLDSEQFKWLETPGPMLRALGAIAYGLVWLIARSFFRLKVYGLHNLPREGHFVITPNHRSYLDAPTLGAALPLRVLLQTHWAGATTIMLRNGFMRLVTRFAQVLPIEHGAGLGLKNLALGAAVLQRKHNLIWFPEGNISPTDDMLPFHQGLGLILEQQPAPVVPVRIEGTREALPYGSWRVRQHPLTVTFGEPITSEALIAMGQGATPAAKMMDGLRQRMHQMSENGPTS